MKMASETVGWHLKRIVPPENKPDSDILLNIIGKKYSCGRSKRNDIICPNDSISRTHCIFFRKETNVDIEDLKSSNGVFINGKRQKPHKQIKLNNGDIIGIGSELTKPNDLKTFVYELKKQVIVDLEQEFNNKLSKLTTNETIHEARQRVTIPTTQLDEDSKSYMTMSIEISVNNSHKGQVPNIYLNRLPLTECMENPEALKIKTKNLGPENIHVLVNEYESDDDFKLRISDEENETDGNFNLKNSINEIQNLQSTNNTLTINNSDRSSENSENFDNIAAKENIDPRTYNPIKNAVSTEKSYKSDHIAVKGINAAWEIAFKALSNQKTFIFNPNPFPNSQYLNTHNMYSNFESPFVNSQFNHQNLHHNHKNSYSIYHNYVPHGQTPFSNAMPITQIPYSNGQLPQHPHYQTLNSNVNQSHNDDEAEFKCKKPLVPKIIGVEKVDFPRFKNLRSLYSLKSNPSYEMMKLNKVTPLNIPKPHAALNSHGISSPQIQSCKENNNLNLRKMKITKKVKPMIEETEKLKTPVSADNYFCSIVKTKEVIMNVISWRPAEFQSFFSKEIPSVVDTERLKKIPKTYDNFDEYCKIHIPLILLDISYRIKIAYNDIENKMKFYCEVAKNSAVKHSIDDSESYILGFRIHVSVLKPNLRESLKIGDFLRIHTTKGRTHFRTLVFGYVCSECSNTEQSKGGILGDNRLIKTYKVVTKLLDFDICESKIQEIIVITSLLPSIELVKALEQFKTSEIMTLILNPMLEDYQLENLLDPKMDINSDLVTKDNLNYIQKYAVRRISYVGARRERKVVLIEGPQGTGKTRTITNIILEVLESQIQKKDQQIKILICAVSHSAIHEIVHRLYDIKKRLGKKILKMVCVGALDDMSTRARDFSLQELAKKHIDTNLKDFSSHDSLVPFEQQLNQLQRKINIMKDIKKRSQNTTLRLALFTRYLEIKRSGRKVTDIRPHEYTKLLEVAEQTILLGANVIICTLDECYSSRMSQAFSMKNLIPMCIVDEATQSVESDMFKLLSFGVKTLILAGDTGRTSTRFLGLPVLEKQTSLFSRIKSKLDETACSPIIKFKTY